MNDWLRVTTIGGDDYECRMTILKTDDTTITVTRPWHHHWTDGWDWKTIIRQWLSDVPETFEPYDGLAEWLRDADSERIVRTLMTNGAGWLIRDEYETIPMFCPMCGGRLEQSERKE